MKRILLAVLALTLPVSVFAQTDTLIHPKKKTEVSFSVSLQSFSVGEGKSSTSMLFAARIGFFIQGGLQIEPEGILLLSSGSPAYMLNGNLVYNFTGTGKGVPFLLAGYGIANTVPIFNLPFYSTNMTIGVLNLGAGIKAFVADNVAVRGEYRFQKFTGEEHQENAFGFSYTQKTDARIHSFQFGIVIVP